ncbi:DUF397 domain-containing protein [Streptomyces roseirectus]|uniref:DUF397 domain-containing protein n=1 Tax=Streptomyces roseirectus TaxID=2768066 RepID=A0A7H0IFY4_9ACTN|nr:DUF397 domain-containing protein [Streptomyces roseirectus]QNP71700.1 DUF397 domain-containing protein [Streptomyces roseirectus]
MNHVDDASTLPVTWRKSSASAAQSDCVECGVVDDQTVAVRDSKRSTGPALLLGRHQLALFLKAVTEEA